MHRVLTPPSAIDGQSIRIRDLRAVHHLVDVLRINVGDQLECFDGTGRSYVGAVSECTRRQVVLRIDRHRQEPASALQLTLAHALVKPSHFEWALQKTTELGVTRILPMVTARTTVRPSMHGRESMKLVRWRRIVEGAAEQCGRATVPELAPPQSFERVLESLCARPALLLTLDHAAAPLAPCLERLKGIDELAVMIGPEGDFSPDEVALAQRRGVSLVRLGPLPLRSETAALAVLAIVQHAVGML